MNVVIKKSDKTVIWVNPDPKKLSGVEAYGEFKPSTMQIIFCPGYKPPIGEAFKPPIAGDTILQFQPKTVWSKSNPFASRKLSSWEDEINPSETIIEPKFDLVEEQKIYKRFQSFNGNDWVVDTAAEYESSIPQILTPAQAEIILHRTGKLESVEQILAHPDTPIEAKIYWKKAQIIERKNSYLNTLATAIDLTKQQIDNLFIEGAKIV
jgi:hypothetical protein